MLHCLPLLSRHSQSEVHSNGRNLSDCLHCRHPGCQVVPGLSVPDPGEGVETLVGDLEEPYRGTQRLPQPLLRVCGACRQPVRVFPSVKCPTHGYISPSNVLSIRKD